jgi:hypothetical protein
MDIVKRIREIVSYLVSATAIHDPDMAKVFADELDVLLPTLELQENGK